MRSPLRMMQCRSNLCTGCGSVQCLSAGNCRRLYKSRAFQMREILLHDTLLCFCAI
ncbi:hypothetical protein B0H10DRAFT_2019256 [Mycena sp. CBHHK59/15]|nr:hypothetical protein B0H10DRAFT_2019256 [Mycena sp. CBHHK59/15]